MNTFLKNQENNYAKKEKNKKGKKGKKGKKI